MYLINFEFLKNWELTIDHLKIEKLKNFFHLGSPNDVTININNVLSC